MEKILYMSNYSGERSRCFYREFLEDIRKDQAKSVYYILPNGKLINYYREKVLEDLGGNFSLNLYTFDDIVKQTIGQENIIPDQFKSLILSQILLRLKDQGQLVYYRELIKLDGFVSSLIDIISSLKTDLIKSQDLTSRTQEAKYLELGLIYQAYEDYLLENELLDREGAYFKFMDQLDQGVKLASLDKVYIDEFFDFRPIELKLLEFLSREDIKIYVNIANMIQGENIQLDQTRASLLGLGFKLEEKIYKTNSFASLGYSIFSQVQEKIRAQVDLISAPSKYLEVKKVFQEIKKDIRSGMALEDIGLIPLGEDYMDLLGLVNQEEKLALDQDFTRPILDYRLAGEIINLLKLASQGDFNQLLLNRLGSKYFMDIDIEEKNKLLSLVYNERPGSLKDLKKLLGSRSLDLGEEDLGLLSYLQGLVQEIENLKDLGSILDFNHYLYEIFAKYNLEESISQLLSKDLDSFILETRVYQEVEGVLDQLESFADYENIISLDKYIKLLEDFFQAKSLVSYRRVGGGVRVLKLINNRGFSFKSLYILGLAQNVYPNLGESNFLFQDKNQEDLRAMGIKYKDYGARLDNEIAKFSRSISSVKDKLVLSYTRGEGGENPSSIFLDEVVRRVEAVKNLEVDFSYIFKEDFHSITNQEEHFNHLLMNINNLDPEKSYPLDQDLFKRLNRALDIEIQRAQGPSAYSGLLEKPRVKEEIYKLYKDFSYSATSLDTYSQCPFRFFLKYVLGLEESYKDQSEDFLGLGNLYHLVLKDFYSNYYDKNLDQATRQDLIKDLFEKYRQELGLRQENQLDQLYLASKRKNLEDFISMDLERIQAQGLVPFSFEYRLPKGFKLGSTRLVGTIDRIDKLGDQSVLIDYKSGIGPGMKKIQEGLSFQMPIYMISQREKNPLAGLYGNIGKAKYDLAFGIDKSIPEIKSKRSGKFDSREDMDIFLDEVGEKIQEIRQAIMEGDFSLEPRLCSDYCIYKKICRYRAGD